MRRPDIHCRREWPSADEGIFRQSLPRGMPNSGRSGLGARRPQGCGDQLGECRRYRCTAGGNLRLARRNDGVALHARSGSASPLTGGDAHAREREANSILAPKRKVRHSERKYAVKSNTFFGVVRSRGLEPPRVAPLAPQASASTNSATTACGVGACRKRRATARM